VFKEGLLWQVTTDRPQLNPVELVLLRWSMRGNPERGARGSSRHVTLAVR